MKTLLTILATALFLIGCTDADVASRNLSKAADMFELERRIVFIMALPAVYQVFPDQNKGDK